MSAEAFEQCLSTDPDLTSPLGHRHCAAVVAQHLIMAVLVMVVRDEKSRPLLSKIDEAKSALIGYTRYQEDLLLERACRQNHFAKDLESASDPFGRYTADKLYRANALRKAK